ncbi:hypothetical protein [Cellulosimicrobium sp. Marseille-Q8652]
MTDGPTVPDRARGEVARLWAGDPGGPDGRAVGYLVTRECTHWDTVGPHAFPRHVNPEPRVQWRVHLDDPARDDVYCDDPDAPCVGRHDDTLTLAGDVLHVQWLAGREAETAWARHGW